MPANTLPALTQSRNQVQQDLNKIEGMPTFTALGTGLDITTEGSTSTLDVNLKTINGADIRGSGNVVIATYKTFNANWPTTSTISAFCAAVNADATTSAGLVYLGELRCSDLPFSGNADAVVEIIDGSGTSNKVIHITITSGNINPYRWEYTYWNNGSNVSGWVAFQTKIDVNPTTSSSSPALTGLTIDGTSYAIPEDEVLTDSEVDACINAQIITTTLTNGTVQGPTVMVDTASITLAPSTGYALPVQITVNGVTGTSGSTGVTWSYNATTGLITLSNATEEVIITATCRQVYTITTNVTNGSSSGDTTIVDSATITIAPTSRYSLPSMILVNGTPGTSGSIGATWSYNSTTGAITLSNPTANITITATCVEVPSIQDVSNTTWVINSTECEEGFGEYIFSSIEDGGEPHLGYAFVFRIGYYVEEFWWGDPEPSANNLSWSYVDNISFMTNYFPIQVGARISFGEFVEACEHGVPTDSQANLISWLQSHATQQVG